MKEDAASSQLEDSAEATGFELWRRRAGLALAPVAFAIAWYAASGLDRPAHRLAAILAAVLVLWVSEAIPMAMTAFLGVAAAVLLGVAPARKRSRPSPIRSSSSSSAPSSWREPSSATASIDASPSQSSRSPGSVPARGECSPPTRW